MSNLPHAMNDGGQRAAWEHLYAAQARPWRGAADLDMTCLPAGTAVLDLGCGNGKTAAALLEHGCRTTGADWSAAAVASCRQRFGGRAEFVIADAARLPFADQTFGAVTAVHLFEHLEDAAAAQAAGEIYRVLVSGGLCLFRSFAAGDMRDDGRPAAVRNGIRYVYRTEADCRRLFSAFETVALSTKCEPTRFGTVRVRVEGLFRRPV